MKTIDNSKKYIEIINKHIFNKFIHNNKNLLILKELIKFTFTPIFKIVNKIINIILLILYKIYTKLIVYLIDLIYKLVIRLCLILSKNKRIF